MTIDMAGYYDILDAECGNATECICNPENDDEDTEDHEDDTTTV